MHWALGTCQVYSSSCRTAIFHSLCFSENVKKQTKENKNPHPLMEPDLARLDRRQLSSHPPPKSSKWRVLCGSVQRGWRKVDWVTPRKHAPPQKKRGKAFLNHLIFILNIQVITGFKPAPSALNYTLSSCGLVSVFLFWFMWEKGITCFLFCFFGLRILVLIQPHGLKLAAFSLNEWPSTVLQWCFSWN